MTLNPEVVTNTERGVVWQSFAAGFFSTLGMIAAITLYQNRSAVKALVREALSEH